MTFPSRIDLSTNIDLLIYTKVGDYTKVLGLFLCTPQCFTWHTLLDLPRMSSSLIFGSLAHGYYIPGTDGRTIMAYMRSEKYGDGYDYCNKSSEV